MGYVLILSQTSPVISDFSLASPPLTRGAACPCTARLALVTQSRPSANSALPSSTRAGARTGEADSGLPA